MSSTSMRNCGCARRWRTISKKPWHDVTVEAQLYDRDKQARISAALINVNVSVSRAECWLNRGCGRCDEPFEMECRKSESVHAGNHLEGFSGTTPGERQQPRRIP